MAVARVLLAGLLLGGALAAFQYSRPIPSVPATVTLRAAERVGGVPPPIPWPAHGEAALAVGGLGILGTSGGEQPLPTASTAKMMTALLTVEDHPLAAGATGPVLTITAADVASYWRDVSQDQSTVPVRVGERLTEYQVLEGLLIPSGNNLAEFLAAWDAGSVPTFVGKMNARAVALGMTHTHFADPSGFSPQTVSVPDDLLMLARVAMEDPVFSQVVGQTRAILPVAGVERNNDTMLGQSGIVGVKTGSSTAAGGAFVFAADVTADAAVFRVYGAVMGQPNLPAAFAAVPGLITAIRGGLHFGILQSKLERMGFYQPAWGGPVGVHAAAVLSLRSYDGMTLQRRITLRGSVNAPLAAGAVVGSLTLELGEQKAVIPVVTGPPLTGPTVWWRLSRRAGG